MSPNLVNAKFGSNKRPKVESDAVMTTNRGVILLNEKVIQKYLGKCKYVDITYNYAVNSLIIKPVEKKGKNSVYVHRTRKGKVAIIVNKNKLRKAGADISVGKYFKCIWDSVKKEIIINFGNPVSRDSL